MYNQILELYLYCRCGSGSFEGRIQDFKLGGGDIAPSGGKRKHFWDISCEKSRFYAAKKIIFFPILGGGRRVRPPPPGCTPVLCVHLFC